ncbi:MAG TPA: hypothetical protein VFS00_04060 [Polyangiaceae bacterium]|nr:hypothetical protein [Polyangiaceae bacterium]
MNRLKLCAWLLGASIVTVASACRDEDDPTPTTPRAGAAGVGGAGGGGGSAGVPGAGNAGTGNVAGNGTGAGAGTAGVPGAGSGGAGGVDDAIVATLAQLNNPNHPQVVPRNARVRVSGLVAISKKYLVSQSSSGSCLWGFFATTAGATTQEYGSIQVIAYGEGATSVGSGGAAGSGGAIRCPSTPDKAGPIPNDLKPGDVVDVVGYNDFFIPTGEKGCDNGTNPPLAAGQRQLENSLVTVVGTAAVPAPKEFTTKEELDLLGNSTVASDIFNKWGGGLVKMSGSFRIDPARFPTSPPSGTANCAAPFGDLLFSETTLAANNNIFFGDLSGGGPRDSATKRLPHTKDTIFTSVVGVYTVDFCTWAVSARGPEDLAPAATGNCFVPPP